MQNPLEITLKKKKLLFYYQENDSTCGVGAGRSHLINCHGIPLSEKEIIEKAEISSSRHTILKDGLDVPNWQKLAKELNLNFSEDVSGNIDKDVSGNIDNLVRLTKDGILPIIHRPSEIDGEGHYIIVYEANHMISFFDPYNEFGGLKKENREEFYQKWYSPELKERWYMFLTKKYLQRKK